MSRSNDAGHFFQTSDALATTERKTAKSKNKHGNPITLPSKILAVIPDPRSENAVFIAEAAGTIKRVELEGGSIENVFTKGTAPLTCLTFSTASGQLFAGCWDKNIYSVNVSPWQPSAKPIVAHTDFVKCLLATTLNGKPILISGGADATIIVWDIETRTPLHKLKGHTKSLQDLAIDLLSLPDGETEPGESFVLFSASSDREIRRWHISTSSAYETQESLGAPILAHETSVYKLCFDSDGDLWTASADKTAQHLVREAGGEGGVGGMVEGEWEADTTLAHPDFVRDIVVHEELGVVVTACRDEEVRVWDLSSGDLVCTYSGHFEEVTGLVVRGRGVVSVSIDGTVRRWGLTRQDMERYEEEVAKEANGEGEEGGNKAVGEGVLTAEEEAELAELMDDSD